LGQDAKQIQNAGQVRRDAILTGDPGIEGVIKPRRFARGRQ
jgi:hypothetical protein